MQYCNALLLNVTFPNTAANAELELLKLRPLLREQQIICIKATYSTWSHKNTTSVHFLCNTVLCTLLHISVMIWVCFSLTLFCTHTLSHTHTHTHTHTCILTHRPLSPSPVCHHNQRSRCFAVTPVLTLI